MNIRKIILEEIEDFNWIKDIKIGLKVDEKYVITSENGLIKYTMIYCGRGTTIHPKTNEEIDGHRFRDPNQEKWNKKCNSWWSDSNLIAHMRRGHIVPYEEHMNEDFDWIKDIGKDRLPSIERILKSGWNAPISCIGDDGKVRLDKVDMNSFEEREDGWQMLFTQWCHGNPMSYTATKSGDNPVIYVRTPINEQEDFDWIKDIKITPLTVAEDIIDQTEIMPDAFMGAPMISVPFTNLQYSEPIMFISVVQHFDDYITKHYGDKDILFRNSVWNMWSHEINNRLKQLNESTSFGWIDNIPKYPAGVIIDTAASKMSEEEIMSLLDKWGFKWEGGHNIFDEDGVPYIENPYRWILVGPMEYTHKKDTSNIQTICNNCIMHDYVHPHKGNYDFTKYHIITL